MREKPTPYDTGKIKIGECYIRDTRPQLNAFEEKLQQALLHSGEQGINDFMSRYPRTSAVIIIVGLTLVLALVEAIK